MNLNGNSWSIDALATDHHLTNLTHLVQAVNGPMFKRSIWRLVSQVVKKGPLAGAETVLPAHGGFPDALNAAGKTPIKLNDMQKKKLRN